MSSVQKISDEDIVIDSVKYSLSVVPAKTSQVVVERRQHLLGSLDIASLVQDLGHLGKFVKIAYNGVAGATELQIEVQRIGYEVVELADKSAVTVALFQSASKKVLDELQGCYQYLLDGLEEMALDNYSAISMIAHKMAQAAEDLKDRFEAAAEKTKKTLEKTQTAKGQEEDKKKKLEADLAFFKMQQDLANTASQEATKAFNRADSLYQKAQMKEDKALDSASNLGSILMRSMSSLAAKATGDEAMDSVSPKEAFKQANEEKMKHIEEMNKQQDARLQALLKMKEMASRIETTTVDGKISDSTIIALHQAIGALKQLADVMMQAALFWHQLHEHCLEIAEGHVKKQVEQAIEKYPPEKRRVIWTSTAFKTKAIKEYASWVALEDVCGMYKASIMSTQTELHNYMKENPTIEESRVNLKQLALDFQNDVEEAQAKIVKDQKENRTKMLALKASTN